MKWKKIITLLILFIVLSKQFFFNKWLGYESIPNPVNILDERDYTFVGYTFRKTGIPTGWSMFDITLKPGEGGSGLTFDGLSIRKGDELPSLRNIQEFDYPARVVTQVDVGKGQEYIVLIQPFLYHSPFAGMIYSLGIKEEPKNFGDLKVEDYRLIALYISVITGILIGITAFLISNSLITSLFSFIIYSSVTTYVLASRYALIENVLIPLSLLAIIFLNLFKDTKNSRIKKLLLVFGGIVTGVGISTKISGGFILVAGVLILINYKTSIKKMLWYIIPSLIIGSSFYLYGFYVDADYMLSTFLNQSGRSFFGSLNFLKAAAQLPFEGFPVDGYWLWGIISLILLSRRKIGKEILIGAGVYLSVILFFGGANYAWYYLPLVPFLIIASAIELKSIIFRPNPVSLGLLFLLPLSSSFYWGFLVHHQNNQINIYRILLTIFTLVITALALKPKLEKLKFIKKYKKMIQMVWIGGIILLIYQLNKWNFQGFQYIIANFEKLPEMFINQ